MKIEKINDNQIRCTLTSDDLADRQIKISELAYGTEKAKSLFRDMMLQAHDEFGFEADNIPLMIEAIPITSDSIVLIITKVEDPEELDTRFSRFTPLSKEDSASDQHVAPETTGADDILDLFHKLCDSKMKEKEKENKTETDTSKDSSKTKNEKEEQPEQTSKSSPSENLPPLNLMRIFNFHSLDQIIQAAGNLQDIFHGENSLYKDQRGNYLLVLHQSGVSPEDFNKLCNILSEYGKGKGCNQAREAYLAEHEEIIIKKQALQNLSFLSA